MGRLAQGNQHGVKATDTLDFIQQSEVPFRQPITYASFICNHRPLKTEQWIVRLIVGGDKLEYTADSGSPAIKLVETKILVNSVILDAQKVARFMSCNLKDFYLATLMENPEFIKVNLKFFPEEIINKYTLRTLV